MIASRLMLVQPIRFKHIVLLQIELHIATIEANRHSKPNNKSYRPPILERSMRMPASTGFCTADAPSSSPGTGVVVAVSG